MNVKSLVTMHYENTSDWTLGENEPNTNPNKPNLAEAKMSANTYFTRNYENEPFWSLPENKPNQACLEQRRMDPIREKARKERNPSPNKGL